MASIPASVSKATPIGAAYVKDSSSARSDGGAVAFGDQIDDVAHDPVDLEVLRRVDAGDAGGEHLALVGRGDDAADDDRDLTAGLVEQADDVGDELAVRPREDREADHVNVFLDRRADDLLGGEADAGVDHLHADVARPDRDLLGAIGVAVEAGLADQDLEPVTDRLGDVVDLGAGA